MDNYNWIYQQIINLKLQLSSSESEYGDWKNLKQLDENCYTEEEMAKYRAGRAAIRAKINELQQK